MPSGPQNVAGTPKNDGGGAAPHPILKLAGLAEILDGVAAGLKELADRPVDNEWIPAHRRPAQTARSLVSRAARDLRATVTRAQRQGKVPQ